MYILVCTYSTVLLEKLTGFQLVKKFPAFYGTRRFITAFTNALHLSLSTVCMFRNTVLFYGEELWATCPTPKLEDHPLSAVRDCLFYIFAATLHIGGRSSIRNLRTRHDVVTGTHISQNLSVLFSEIKDISSLFIVIYVYNLVQNISYELLEHVKSGRNM